MAPFALPRLDFVKKQFEKIDQYRWYCSILKEHSRKGFTMYGMPAPIFVGLRMAYIQTKDNFGVAEMKDLLVPLCNATFLLNSRTAPVSQLKEFKPKSTVTFNREMIKDFTKAKKKLDRDIQSHIICMNMIGEVQKEARKFGEKYKECFMKLNVFIDKYNCGDGFILEKHNGKYEDLKKRHVNAAEIFETKLALLQRKVNNAKALRKTITEKVASLKYSLTGLMKTGIRDAYNTLLEAVGRNRKHEGFDVIKEQLDRVSVNKMAEEFYRVTSEVYDTEIPEEFMFETNFKEIVPPSKLLPCDYESKGMHNNTFLKRTRDVTFEFQDLPKKIEFADKCFFPNSGGCRITKDQVKDKNSEEFLNINSGYQVKLKLLLMGGSVGFGWSRKNCFSSKKWGFYPLNTANNVIHSMIASFSAPLQVSSTVHDGMVCPERFPGFKDFSYEQRILKITKDLDFIPIEKPRRQAWDEKSVYSSSEELFI